MAARTELGVPLTAREREIALTVADGLTDRQIASRLCISEHTVHAHLRSAYAKTGTGRRTRLLAWLARQEPAPAAPVPGEDARLGTRPGPPRRTSRPAPLHAGAQRMT